MFIKKIVIILALTLGGNARAQSAADQPGLSRQMKSGIRLYEVGDDMEAMNRFMDILTHGDPAERPMANQYLNLITQRMSSSGSAKNSPRPAPAPAAEPASEPAPPAAATRPATTAPIAVESAEPAPAAPTAPAPDRATATVQTLNASNKALMRQEIASRLDAAVAKSLDDLRAIDGIRVIMRPNDKPAALGIPSPLLFRSGISFQRDASKILDPLTKLVYALGATQVVILPEGTALGDAKVLDMRRTMGVSAHLYDAGIAPPRVRVNLLNTQVDMPRPLMDFKGIVIAFVYDQPLNLENEDALGDDQGPPLSLGIFPAQLRPSKNQGAIIEFSVADPPDGVTSWKFQLLQPAAGGEELAPLQEVVGGGPVFHQIFWNARKNYFGAPLAPGRYECVLTATDGKNRQRALHRWITVLGDTQAEESLLGASEPAQAASAASASAAPVAAAAPAASAAAADLVKGVKPAVQISQTPRVRKPRRRVKKVAAKTKKKPRKSPSAEPKAAAAETGTYRLTFDPNTHELTPAAERSLAKAAHALSRHPLESLKVVGHASPDEADAAALADRRAKLVVGLLINRYQIDPKKIVSSAADKPDSAMVEVVIASND